MRSLLALAITVLPALGAAAQSGDVVVTVATQNREALVVGKPASFIVSAENRGTSVSAPVVVSITVPTGIEITRSFCSGTGLRCSFAGLKSGGAQAAFAFDAIIHRAPGPLTLEVTAEGADVRPENAHLLVVLPVFPDPGLIPSIESPDRGDAQNRAAVRYVVNNTSDRDSAAKLNVDDISTLSRVSIDADGWVCSQPQPTMTCSTQVVPAHGSRAITVTYQLPSETGFLNAGMTVTAASPDPGLVFPSVVVSRTLLFSRWFRVASTADSGAGTLRRAIDDLDAQCETIPCGIEFALDAQESGWPAIAPLSPLPPVRAWFVTIKGGANAPGIFLDGRNAGDADGLAIEAQGADVRWLAVGRFARNGLLLTKTDFFPRSTIAHNAFGLDPSGNPAPNGLRGLRADHFTGDIVANAIAGNVHSGIFITAATTASIRDNRLTGNGASGIFLGGLTFETDLKGNTIEANAQFGIAVENASDLTIGPNVIRDNGLQAIDVGLDGPTPSGVPVIGNVRFDAATGETVITGTLTPPPLPFGFYDHVDVLLYATHSPRAEASQILGVAHALDAHNFELRVAGPLQDCYVTGASVTTEVLADLGPRTFVSELGEAVPVPFPCGQQETFSARLSWRQRLDAQNQLVWSGR